MALKTATIPITDHSTEGVCTSYYTVRYKASFTETWTLLSPNPVIPPIVIPGLAPSTVYNLEVTRHCCDGISSNALTANFTTPA